MGFRKLKQRLEAGDYSAYNEIEKEPEVTSSSWLGRLLTGLIRQIPIVGDATVGVTDRLEKQAHNDWSQKRKEWIDRQQQYIGKYLQNKESYNKWLKRKTADERKLDIFKEIKAIKDKRDSMKYSGENGDPHKIHEYGLAGFRRRAKNSLSTDRSTSYLKSAREFGMPETTTGTSQQEADRKITYNQKEANRLARELRQQDIDDLDKNGFQMEWEN
jgi:hypothetical protein